MLMAGLVDPTLLFEDWSCRRCGILGAVVVGRPLSTSGTSLGWLAATKPDKYGLLSPPGFVGIPFLPSSSISESDGRC